MATDYISREAAIEKITALINESGKYTAYESGAGDACFIVEHDIPAADVRPVVRGRWVHSPDTGTTICTACGWSIEECFYDASTNKDYPFCPNCGADMRPERGTKE